MGTISHLRALEAESIYVLREVVAVRAAGVAVFHWEGLVNIAASGAEGVLAGQGAIPTAARGYHGQISRDDRISRPYGARDGAGSDCLHPPTLGTQKCCHLLKTRALLDAIAQYAFDAAIGGHGGRRKSPVPRNGSTPSAVPMASGRSQEPAARCATIHRHKVERFAALLVV